MARIGKLALLAGLLLSAPSAAAPVANDSARLVYKFGAGSWTENLVVRPSGQILVTRMDNGQLWSVDPASANATLVHSFPAHALTGIVEVRPDVFAVVSGEQDVSNSTNVDGSYAVWTIDLGASPPVASRVAALPALANVNGIAALDNSSVLVGDIAKGTVTLVPLSGSKSAGAAGDGGAVIADAESMGPPSTGPPYGIDGMKFRDGALWFTNIGKKTFNKVQVDGAGKQKGTVVKLQDGLAGDDFTFSYDGSIYLTTNFDKTVVKISPDGKGVPQVVANIDGACACQFGRTAADKTVLYVTTSHGEVYAVKT